MSERVDDSRWEGIAGRVRGVIWGTSDPRLRATWRVLLPWPVLWFVAGTAGVTLASAVVPAETSPPASMMAFGLFQAAFFGVAWVGWARYLDYRPLSAYGLSVSRSWLADLLLGFGAVIAGYGVWHAMGGALGWTSVEVSLTGSVASLAGLGAVFVGVIVNVWVQETVFFGVTLRNAAEGLSGRGVVPSRAVVAAWAVAILIFTVKHRPRTAEAGLNLILALGIFGLLYVHTGELALSIGAHTGVNYAGNALFASAAGAGAGPTVFRVTESLSGLPGSLSAGAIPQLLVAYLLLVVGLAWRRGEVPVETDLTRWRGREDGTDAPTADG